MEFSAENTEIKNETLDNETLDLDTHCFSYRVTMIVQVLSSDEVIARAQLDNQGGYVSKRDVEFLGSTPLYLNDSPESIDSSK